MTMANAFSAFQRTIPITFPASIVPALNGGRWQRIGALPSGVVLPALRLVQLTVPFAYLRSVGGAGGRQYMQIRALIRPSGVHYDYFYAAVGAVPVPFTAASTGLGAPPQGTWVPYLGDLPTAVGAAVASRHRPGTSWRLQVGSGHWTIADAAAGSGGAVYALGSPPQARRAAVSAWRWERAPLRATPYAGSAASPWPPAPAGWYATDPDDETSAALVPSMLGELPPYHYHDAFTRTGLYRFFAFETGAGQRAVSALRYWGRAADNVSTLGDVPTDKGAFDADISQGDSALASGDFTGAVTAYQGAGNFGAQTLGPEIDTQTGGASQPLTQQAWGINSTLAGINPQGANQDDATTAQGLVTQMKALYEQAIALPPGGSPGATAPAGGGTPTSPAAKAAAVAMNNALAAHGYKKSDQGLYGAFQSAAGLSPVDSFPGTNTMNALFLSLAAQNIAPANVKIYPWKSSGAYDGVNAPTLAEWLGTSAGPAGTTPGGSTTRTTTTTQASAASTGGVVAGVLAAGAALGGVIWAATTGHLHFPR